MAADSKSIVGPHQCELPPVNEDFNDRRDVVAGLDGPRFRGRGGARTSARKASLRVPGESARDRRCETETELDHGRRSEAGSPGTKADRVSGAGRFDAGTAGRGQRGSVGQWDSGVRPKRAGGIPGPTAGIALAMPLESTGV